MSAPALVNQASATESSTFDDLESNVQSYARSFPVIFSRAEGSYLFDERGERYIDFLAGAGGLHSAEN